MPDPDEGRAARSRDLERLLTFVDAIAAVAITLLVLPLVDLVGQVDDGHTVAHLIRDHANEFWSFLLSFTVIARLWLAQHRLMGTVIQASRAVTNLLVLWTLALVFLPFPTALLAGSGDQWLTKVLYIGTLTLNAVCLAAVAYLASRNPALHEPDHVPRVVPSAFSAVMLGLALAITLIFPATGYYPMLLIVSDNVYGWLRRALHRE